MRYSITVIIILLCMLGWKETLMDNSVDSRNLLNVSILDETADSQGFFNVLVI